MSSRKTFLDRPFYHTKDYQTPLWHPEPETEPPLPSDFALKTPTLKPTHSTQMYKHHHFDPFRRSHSVEPPSPTDPFVSSSTPSPAAPPSTSRKEARRSRRHSFKEVHAEVKIALGVKDLLEEKAKQKRRNGGGSTEHAAAPVRMNEMLIAAEGLLETMVAKDGKGSRRKSQGGAMLAMEQAAVASGGVAFVEERVKAMAAKRSQPAPPTSNSNRDTHYSSTSSNRRAKEAAGALGAVGAVGLGLEYLEGRAQRRARSAQASSTIDENAARRGTSPAPVFRESSLPFATSIGPASPSMPTQLKTFMSQLTKSEHFLVQHAAAFLLLREPEIMQVVGNLNDMVQLLQRDGSQSGGYTEVLFGVSLKVLLKYEATDSHHGAGPGTIKIPTFIDHCITALMEMDMTVEGILRKSGNLRQITEVVNALDHAGGNGYTVDLSGLDPTTLASLFKHFLRVLPDPVLTGRLFSLFLAAAHIKNASARKRAMHLVVCLLPKANRDVFEVVFLFLDWVSTFAHVDFKIGNGMDLSNIAKVMAPTLLHPSHRDPHPTEVPAMIAATLQLLEDQHILHEIPLELAHILHVPMPATKDSRTILQRMRSVL